MNRAWQAAGIAALAGLGVSCATRAARLRPPPSPPVVERQIRNARLVGDQDERLRTLQQKVAAAPDDLPARLALVELYLERDLPDLAAEHCRLAGGRFPDAERLRVLQAQSMYRTGLYREGADSLAEFLAKHRGASAAAFSWLGILYDEAGYLEHGETAHRSAANLEPKSAAFHNNLGYNLLRQERGAEAATEFRQALQLEPGSRFARNNLASALMMPRPGAAPGPQAASELRREALVNFRAAGDPASAHSDLAAVLIEQGRYPEARAEISAALRYNSSHSGALANLRLLGELDGKPAQVAWQTPASQWSRWRSALKRAVIGSSSTQGQKRVARVRAWRTEKP